MIGGSIMSDYIDNKLQEIKIARILEMNEGLSSTSEENNLINMDVLATIFEEIELIKEKIGITE